MLEPDRIRWAPFACLALIALIAAAATASFGPPPSAPTLPAPPTTQDAATTVQDAKAGTVATVHEVALALARTVPEAPAPAKQPGSPPGSRSPGTPDPGAAPVATGILTWGKTQLAPVRAVLPSDPVGLAKDTAHRASQIPESILSPPHDNGADTPAAEPASAAVEPVIPSLAPTLLIAAGATAAVTFFGFWVAGSSGAVGSGAAAGAASRAGDMRRFLPFASPLFTRFERDTVLGHPRREALYAMILQEPGISLQALGDATSLSRTAVIHHLRLLEQQHLIVSRRVGRSRHYFENGGRYGHDQKEAYAILQNGRSREVAEFIKGHPGSMQKALCQALGIQPSIAHWHVRRLEEAKVVETVRQGRTVAYFPGPGLQAMASNGVAQQANAASAATA